MESDVVLTSQFLDPYVSHTMLKQNFLKAKDIVVDMCGAPDAEADDDDDMFTAAGAEAKVPPIQAQLSVYVGMVRDLSKAPPATMPSSKSWWEANGKALPLILRVYMNIGSIMLCSTPSEAVFNQLALTVTDRRGTLGDDRAAALTLSAAVAKLDSINLAKPIASVSSSDDDDVLESVMEELDAQKSESGVLSAKYVDLVEDEFNADDEL